MGAPRVSHVVFMTQMQLVRHFVICFSCADIRNALGNRRCQPGTEKSHGGSKASAFRCAAGRNPLNKNLSAPSPPLPDWTRRFFVASVPDAPTPQRTMNNTEISRRIGNNPSHQLCQNNGVCSRDCRASSLFSIKEAQFSLIK